MWSNRAILDRGCIALQWMPSSRLSSGRISSLLRPATARKCSRHWIKVKRIWLWEVYSIDQYKGRLSNIMNQVGHIPWAQILTNKYISKILPSTGNNAPFFEELMNIAISETAALECKDAPSTGPITFLQRLLLNQSSNPNSLTNARAQHPHLRQHPLRE